MTESASQFVYLRDPRLSAHAIGAAPAWLWAMDASRILWANAVGAAIFDAPGPARLAERRFDANDPAASQIARIAPTLPPNGAPRLERLRGFGAGVGDALTCACACITLSDSTTAVLVLAAEAAGPALPLEERVHRLVAEIDAPIAVFSAEGVLLHAARPALDRLAAAATLILLGAEGLAADALRAGHASGPSKIGALSIERVGQYPATVLVATFGPETAPAGSDEAQAISPAALVADATPAPEARMELAPAFSPPEESGSPEAHAIIEAQPERRFPLRFVWQMDAAGHFQIESGDFIRLTGARTAHALGRPWDEIVGLLAIDPQGQVAQAIATRDTWSGITIEWPVDGTDERLAVELSGLPVFDRDRAFGGYRGFGVCRDARRISRAVSLRYTPTQVAAEALAPAAAEPTPASSYTTPPAEERPVLTVVPPSKNVVPFRASSPADKTPSLSPVERSAFRELAKQLTTRLQEGNDASASLPSPAPEIDDFEGQPAAGSPISEAAGYGRIARETNAMGFVPPSAQPVPSTRAAKNVRAKAPLPGDRSILDQLPVGILVYRLDTLLYANRAFLDWTGYDSVGALAEDGGLDTLFVEPGPESGDDNTEGKPLTISTNRSEQSPAAGRLLTAPWEGETAYVLMLASPQSNERKADQSARGQTDAETQWKKTEEELINAKRQAEKASSAKSEFLAKISHEIRTPLNAIIGFSEVMIGERFGPIANERYREYLKDIHTSGGHLVSLLNDLLDLSKIEAGKLDLTFSKINLNELTQQCVAIMQPQANEERIIIRTSLPPALPAIMADARSVRQIALNLLSNSIKFTDAGGQVIVSTALTDDGEVVLRVRDTGAGMSEKEIKLALEPFRQLATSARGGSGGTGLGLPLTKALAEANRADFSIKSAVNAGTLVEISFPRSRVLAE
jgi:signal transduction histidine kinase